VSGEVRIGEAEKAFLRAWWSFSSMLVRPFMSRSTVVVIIDYEARKRIQLIRKALALFRGRKRGGCGSGRHSGGRCGVGIDAECVHPLLLGGIVERG